ncbi:MAG: hypothetical protein ACFB9M_12950 [Myxococcota bacterium]
MALALLVLGLTAVGLTRPRAWHQAQIRRRLRPLRLLGRNLELLERVRPHGLSYTGRLNHRRVQLRGVAPSWSDQRLCKLSLGVEVFLDPQAAFTLRARTDGWAWRGDQLMACIALSSGFLGILRWGDRLRLDGCRLLLELRGTPNPRELETLLEELCGAADRLEDGAAHPAAALVSMMSSPDAQLRCRALAALAEAEAPELRDALRLSAQDPDDAVQLQAAVIEGRFEEIPNYASSAGFETALAPLEGRPDVLNDVLERLLDAPVPHHERVRWILGALGPCAKPGHLQAALRSSDLSVRLQALRAFRDLERHPEGVSTLRALVEGRSACLEGLDYGQRLTLRRAAVELVGEIGPSSFLPSLRTLSHGAGLLAPLAASARTAARAIRERHQIPSGGQLSFSATPGELSLSSNDRRPETSPVDGGPSDQ